MELNLSNGYRSARRITTLICAVALSWSLVQFEVATVKLKLENTEGIDLSHASIPYILSAMLVYMVFRCTLEYVMQSIEVRRWGYAKVDIRMTLLLAAITLIVIGAAGIKRKIEFVILLTGSIFLLFIVSLLFIKIWNAVLLKLSRILKRPLNARLGLEINDTLTVERSLIFVLKYSFLNVVIFFIALYIAFITQFIPVDQPIEQNDQLIPLLFYIAVGFISIFIFIYRRLFLYSWLFGEHFYNISETSNGKRVTRALFPHYETTWNWYAEPSNTKEKRKGE